MPEINPWLSVILPTFNGARFVAAALESVLAQADDGVEILVSDDGSTDDTRRIVESYARDGRVVPLSGPRVGNWVANTNRASAAARGALMTFLHQDDLWLPGRIAYLKQSLRNYARNAFRINPSRYVDEQGRTVGHIGLPFDGTKTVIEVSCFIERLLVQNFIATPAPVFPRNAFAELGGMDERLWYTADWDLWIRLGSKLPTLVTDAELTGFRLHSRSQTSRGDPDAMREQTELVRQRHLGLVSEPLTREEVDRAGRCAAEVNCALASLAARRTVRWRSLVRSLSELRPASLQRLARDSRLHERVLGRLRA